MTIRRLLATTSLAAMLLAGALMPAVAQPAAPRLAAPGCAAGSSGIGDAYFPYMGNSGYDVRHYTLDLDLDVPAGAIRSASATIQATATVDLCAFNLDFSGLDIDALRIDGVPAAFSRRGQELTVTPARPLARGGEFVVEVAYHGVPFTHATPPAAGILALLAALDAGATPAAEAAATPVDEAAAPAEEEPGGLFLAAPDVDRYGPSLGGWWTTDGSIFVAGEPRGAETWFPVNGHPADKATYTFRLTVDAPYEAVANGRLAARDEVDGRVTTTFVMSSPMASYLATIHAGRLDVVETVGPDDLPLRFAFATSTPDEQRTRLIDVTPDMLDFFAERFGPYPFELAGGTVVDSMVGFALETQTMPIYGVDPVGALPEEDRAANLDSFEEIVAHETAHQWFGDSVSILRWEDVFLNEGLANYGMYLWIEQRDGSAAMQARLRDSYDRIAGMAALAEPGALEGMTATELMAALGPDGEFMTELALEALALPDATLLREISAVEAVAALEAMGISPAAFGGGPVALTGDPGADNLFSSDLVYERGALTAHALRQELGDETFFAVLRAWTARYGGGNATIADFSDTAEEVSGRDLGEFFDAWLFQASLPPLAFPLAGVATPVP
ncbi:MAG: M1 family metallopeptidase [Thermomicrobiales bacterium]|nr:M1 family metallopeptidase [Thermomicrobiales bacterium]